MSIQAYEDLATEPELRKHILKFVGGTTAVTKVFGSTMSVAYSATGVVNITWKDNPKVFLGLLGFGFQATTASAVKNYTATCPSTLTANADGSYSLLLSIWNGSSAADLAAAQWLTLTLGFKETSV